MSNVNYNEETNTTTVEITDNGAFSCFKMYRDSGDPRCLDRHEEARDLKDSIINNSKHSQIVVKYGETYLPLKNR